MKYKLIDAKKADLPIDRMCDILDVSSSGYYAWRKRQPSRRQPTGRYGLSGTYQVAVLRIQWHLWFTAHACRFERRGFVDWAPPHSAPDA